MVYYEKEEMPSSDNQASEDDAVVQDDSENETESTSEEAEESEFRDTSLDPDEDNISDEEKARRLVVKERVAIVHGGGKKARAFQRKQTREPRTLDLIAETNEMLTKLMKVANLSPDLTQLMFSIIKKKDQELVRLRQELIRTQDTLTGTKQHLIPRLVCKAQQAAYLSESVKSLKKALENRPRGKIAISANRSSDSPWENQERSD